MKHQTPGYFEKDVVDFQQFFSKTEACIEAGLQKRDLKPGLISRIFQNLFPTGKKQPAQQAGLDCCQC